MWSKWMKQISPLVLQAIPLALITILMERPSSFWPSQGRDTLYVAGLTTVLSASRSVFRLWMIHNISKIVLTTLHLHLLLIGMQCVGNVGGWLLQSAFLLLSVALILLLVCGSSCIPSFACSWVSCWRCLFCHHCRSHSATLVVFRASLAEYEVATFCYVK